MGFLICYLLIFKLCIYFFKDVMSGVKLKNVNDLSWKVYFCNIRSIMIVGFED